ncbi:MAG: PTS fructose transporter subunit IIA [Comamonadaceae bacterium]|nr:PTS fructose transporter subunit IIA [Comamonadaceae bacterium]RRD56625.1 PTS fructose transporter subunit IIA [Comamonadaceae bacterium OH2545_COT-014]
MNTVLLIAHAPLASALRAGALHVFPDAGDAVLALDISPHEPPEDSLAAARALLATAPAARSVLLLTDVLGATPSNVAQRLAADAGAAPLPLLAGVNLPMLLRALCYRAEPLAAMTERALAGGTQGIVRVAAAPTP